MPELAVLTVHVDVRHHAQEGGAAVDADGQGLAEPVGAAAHVM